jgi:UrcA family protein
LRAPSGAANIPESFQNVAKIADAGRRSRGHRQGSRSKHSLKRTQPCSFAATDKAPEISVDYADLDLSTKAGQNALRSRVSKAAGEVCRKMSRSGHGDPCRSNLTRRTLAAITVPANTAIAAR